MKDDRRPEDGIICDIPEAVDVVAAAINTTQIQPSELKLGHDLRPVARRFLAALDGCPEEGHYIDCGGYVLVKRAEIVKTSSEPLDLDGLPFCPGGYAQRYHAIGQCECPKDIFQTMKGCICATTSRFSWNHLTNCPWRLKWFPR